MLTSTTTLLTLGWCIHVAGWLAAVVIQRGRVAHQGEWVRELVLRLAMLALVVAAVILPAAAVPKGVGFTGLVCFAIGTTLAIIARWRMGQGWGIGVRPHVQPLEEPLFRTLRHPIYVGTTLAVLGQCIAWPNLASLALLAGALLIVPIKIACERVWLRHTPSR